MRAVRYSDYGGPEVLRCDADSPVPEPGPGEALVRVAATSVNPADWKFRAGWFRDWVSLPLPFIPGSDVIGTIERIDGDAGGFSVGDAVVGMTMPPVGGASADYVVLPLRSLAPAPASIPATVAAAIPLAALTAWFALFDGAGLVAGQKVLIHGGAGGVGTFAIQLARHAGAHVIASASPAKHALLRDLGAAEVFDYCGAFEEALHDVDVVLDPWGGAVQDRSFAVLKRGGTLVTLDTVPPPAERCAAYGVRGIAASLAPDGERLAKIVALVEAGAVRPIIDEVFALEDLALAHARSEQGHVTGKLVVSMG